MRILWFTTSPSLAEKKEGMFNFDLKVGDIVKFNGTVQVEP